MKSVVATTHEMDDMAAAAEDLAAAVLGEMRFDKHTCAFLCCDPDMDIHALSAALRERLPCDLVCVSVLASFGGEAGFQEMAATLTVMTADDARFSIAVSEPVRPGKIPEQLEDVYRRALEGLEMEPKLLMIVAPVRLNLILDDYPEELTRLSGGLPVFGGASSGPSEHGKDIVLHNGEDCRDRLVLVLVGGNVRPVFSVKNLSIDFPERTYRVTRAEGNVVHTVGDLTFVDFLRSFDLKLDELAPEESFYFFTANPLMLKSFTEDGDELLLVRALHSLDLKTGSGASFARIPEGTQLFIAAAKRKNIECSAKEAVEELLKIMEENGREGYSYSTVFCISCMSRYLVMAHMSSREGKILSGALPGHLTFSGFYSKGEFAPVSTSGGKLSNQAHNFSIALCAF